MVDYKNTFYSAYLPIISSAVFDNTGKPYDVSKILTPDFLFDKEAYARYSPIYLPITYILSYAVQFASLSALVTHTICWHGKDIWQQTKESFKTHEKYDSFLYRPVGQVSIQSGIEDVYTNPRLGNDPKYEPAPNEPIGLRDVHARLMDRYDDAPLSWYLLTFVAMLIIGIFVVE